MYTFDVQSSESDFSQAFIKIDGTESELQAVKKYLTIYNFGAKYQLKEARSRISFWRSRAERHPDNAEYVSKFNALSEEIKKLEKEIKIEYFDHNEDGLFVPAGYWYIAPKL